MTSDQEPLAMTLAEAMEHLAQQHMWLVPYVWSLDAPTTWEVLRRPTYDEEIFQDLLAATVGRWPTWPEAVSAALGRKVVARDDRAALVEALRHVYDFLWQEFREPNPETGEVMELGAREIWGVVCDALAAVGEET